MTASDRIRRSLRTFFERTLNVVPASDDHDLLESGMLDSLGIVELVLYAEQEHGVILDLETLDLDDIRSIASITELVTAQGLSPGLSA